MSDFPPEWGVTGSERLAQGIGGTVWRVTVAGGEGAIVKRVSHAAMKEQAHALAWLKQQDGRGAVCLLAHEGEWQLMEDGGDFTLAQELERTGDEAAALIASDVLDRLHESAGNMSGLQTLHDRFASLRLAAEREGGRFAEVAHRLPALLDRNAPVVALHGDLHHDNILRGPRGWLAIDPHGLVGDPAYDAANLLYNPVERPDLRTNPDRAFRLARILSSGVGRPAEAILAWAVCHTCLSASWHIEDGNDKEAAASLDVCVAVQRALDMC